MRTSYKKEFKEFKRRIIAESLVAPKNTLFGLSREHIELTLGIPMPLLMESVDVKLQKHILREQFLFEQFLQSVKNAASTLATGVKGAAQTMYSTAIGAAEKKFVQPVKDIIGVIDAIYAIYKNPQLVAELGTALGAVIKKYFDPIITVVNTVFNFFNFISEKTKNVIDKVDKAITKTIDFLKKSFEMAKGFVDKIKAQFDQLTGWQKVALGTGLVVTVQWAYQNIGQERIKSITDKIKAFTDKIVKAFEPAADTKKEAEKITTSGAEAAKKGAQAIAELINEFVNEANETESTEKTDVKKAITGAAALATGGASVAVTETIKELFKEIGTQLLPELNAIATSVIQKVMSTAAMTALSSFAGPFGPFLTAIGKLVGNIGFVVGVIAPITNQFVKKYNDDVAKAETTAVAAGAAPTKPTFVQRARKVIGLEEEKILLGDILYPR